MTLVAAPRQIGATCERQHVQKRIGPWLRTGGREAEPGRDVDGTFEGGEILFRTAHFGCPTKSGLRRSQRPARQPPELWDVPDQDSADGTSPEQLDACWTRLSKHCLRASSANIAGGLNRKDVRRVCGVLKWRRMQRVKTSAWSS